MIGIIELGGGYVQSDLDLFSTNNNLPKINVTSISVDGATNSPGANTPGTGDNPEVALDIEAVAAAYYYCTGTMPTIKVFFAPNSGQSFIDVIDAAVANGCDVLSMSWGLDEFDFGAGGAEAIEAAATTATAAGLVIFASSGDWSSDDQSLNNTNQVNSPASCPHIISCGGTNKITGAEVVWGDGVGTDQGTGGGYSAIFPVQSFQIGAPKAPSGLGRMCPDISADADPNTGYLIVQGGEQYQVGGTSAVAPLYAGLFASFGKKLGYVTPKLWKNQTAFVDITVGSNGGYSAAVGPDPCTGIGVPNGTKLSALFVSTVTAPVYNYVSSAYVPAAGMNPATLTLIGDTGANAVSIQQRGTIVSVTAAGQTLIGTSVSNSQVVEYTIPGDFHVVCNFVQNATPATNDAVTLVGVKSSNTQMTFGTGNDTATLSLCAITTLTANGGAGTNVLNLLSSSIASSLTSPNIVDFTVVK